MSFILILPLVASDIFSSNILVVASKLITSPLGSSSKYSWINLFLIFWAVTLLPESSSGRFEISSGTVPKRVSIFCESPKKFTPTFPPLPFIFVKNKLPSLNNFLSAAVKSCKLVPDAFKNSGVTNFFT